MLLVLLVLHVARVARVACVPNTIAMPMQNEHYVCIATRALLRSIRENIDNLNRSAIRENIDNLNISFGFWGNACTRKRADEHIFK